MVKENSISLHHGWWCVRPPHANPPPAGTMKLAGIPDALLKRLDDLAAQEPAHSEPPISITLPTAYAHGSEATLAAVAASNNVGTTAPRTRWFVTMADAMPLDPPAAATPPAPPKQETVATPPSSSIDTATPSELRERLFQDLTARLQTYSQEKVLGKRRERGQRLFDEMKKALGVLDNKQVTALIPQLAKLDAECAQLAGTGTAYLDELRRGGQVSDEALAWAAQVCLASSFTMGGGLCVRGTSRFFFHHGCV